MGFSEVTAPTFQAGAVQKQIRLEQIDRLAYSKYMDNMPELERSDGEPAELYCIVVKPGDGEMDKGLASAMEEVHRASAADPNRWHNNPEKKREALEGLGKLLAEWQEENGAFTEEELARARALKSGVDLRS